MLTTVFILSALSLLVASDEQAGADLETSSRPMKDAGPGPSKNRS